MSGSETKQPSLAPVELGTVLAGKYRVERIIGQGGMGVVVEARHIVLDEHVALKFLLPAFTEHPEGSARFLREAKAGMRIKSEHVARVSDVGTLENGAPYMVMELLTGSDLARLLRDQGVLGLEDAVDYIVQGSEAIAEAHGRSQAGEPVPDGARRRLAARQGARLRHLEDDDRRRRPDGHGRGAGLGAVHVP
ncbi:hypothetical protein BE20_30660 [Sorangium cellulosum]|nr:hypothetical protein BE20_30660 [Sorangium cellulosum]